MKNKNLLNGIGIIVLFILLVSFSTNFFSVITDDNISCDIVKDSCDGWSECTLETYKGEQIACINGEEIVIYEDEIISSTDSLEKINSGGVYNE